MASYIVNWDTHLSSDTVTNSLLASLRRAKSQTKATFTASAYRNGGNTNSGVLIKDCTLSVDELTRIVNSCKIERTSLRINLYDVPTESDAATHVENHTLLRQLRQILHITEPESGSDPDTILTRVAQLQGVSIQVHDLEGQIQAALALAQETDEERQRAFSLLGELASAAGLPPLPSAKDKQETYVRELSASLRTYSTRVATLEEDNQFLREQSHTLKRDYNDLRGQVKKLEQLTATQRTQLEETTALANHGRASVDRLEDVLRTTRVNLQEVEESYAQTRRELAQLRAIRDDATLTQLSRIETALNAPPKKSNETVAEYTARLAQTAANIVRRATSKKEVDRAQQYTDLSPLHSPLNDLCTLAEIPVPHSFRSLADVGAYLQSVYSTIATRIKKYEEKPSPRRYKSDDGQKDLPLRNTLEHTLEVRNDQIRTIVDSFARSIGIDVKRSYETIPQYEQRVVQDAALLPDRIRNLEQQAAQSKVITVHQSIDELLPSLKRLARHANGVECQLTEASSFSEVATYLGLISTEIDSGLSQRKKAFSAIMRALGDSIGITVFTAPQADFEMTDIKSFEEIAAGIRENRKMITQLGNCVNLYASYINGEALMSEFAQATSDILENPAKLQKYLTHLFIHHQRFLDLKIGRAHISKETIETMESVYLKAFGAEIIRERDVYAFIVSEAARELNTINSQDALLTNPTLVYSLLEQAAQIEQERDELLGRISDLELQIATRPQEVPASVARAMDLTTISDEKLLAQALVNRYASTYHAASEAYLAAFPDGLNEIHENILLGKDVCLVNALRAQTHPDHFEYLGIHHAKSLDDISTTLQHHIQEFDDAQENVSIVSAYYQAKILPAARGSTKGGAPAHIIRHIEEQKHEIIGTYTTSKADWDKRKTVAHQVMSKVMDLESQFENDLATIDSTERQLLNSKPLADYNIAIYSYQSIDQVTNTATTHFIVPTNGHLGKRIICELYQSCPDELTYAIEEDENMKYMDLQLSLANCNENQRERNEALIRVLENKFSSMASAKLGLKVNIMNFGSMTHGKY